MADIPQQTTFFECIFFNENLNILKNDRNFSMGLDPGLALFRRQAIVYINVDIVYRRIYTSVGVTESGIMPLYDRTTTETAMSSGWLPWLSSGALRPAFSVGFSASGDGWGIHPGDISVSLTKTAMHSYLPLYSVLGTSLLLWIYVSMYSYHRPYKHYL